MDSNISVFEYQINYPNLNLETLKKCKPLFNYGMLHVYIKECKNGFKVKKVGKTSKKGTKITYKPIKDETDFKEYKNKIEKMAEDLKLEFEEKIDSIIKYAKSEVEQ